MGGKHRILLGLERFSRDHYRIVFLVALLALLVGAWLGSKLDLESDILALIPAGNRQVDTFRAALERLRLDRLPDGPASKPGRSRGRTSSRTSPTCSPTKLRALDGLVERRRVPVPARRASSSSCSTRTRCCSCRPSGSPSCAEKLADARSGAASAERKLALASPTAAFTEELLAQDPLDLMPLFLNRLAGERGELQIDLSDGYYLSRDGIAR